MKNLFTSLLGRTVSNSASLTPVNRLPLLHFRTTKNLRLLALLVLTIVCISNAWGVQYQKMATNESLSDGANYLIAIEDRKAGKFYFIQSGSTKHLEQTVSGGLVTNPNAATIWTAIASSTNWKFRLKGASTNGYLYNGGGNTTLGTNSGSECTWKVGTGTSDGYTYFTIQRSESTVRYIGWSSSTFAAYTTTNFSIQGSNSNLGQYDGALQIFKELPSKTVSSSVMPTGSGTVTLGTNAASEGEKVSATAAPSAGYLFASWEISGTGSTLSSTTTNPTTITMGTAATTITATFSAKPLTGWSWTYKDAAIPDVVELYIGEYARFDIASYTPSDVINDKKGFVYVAAGDPSTMQPVYSTDDLAHVGHSTSYYTIRGKRAAESTTVVFKSVGNSELTQTMTLRIKPLPVVHFKDLIHGEEFDDVAATVTTGVVTKSKNTPTHDDWSGSPKNTCETGHVHLVGWIESDWADEYLSDETMPNKAEIEASGYFYAPNAAIDTEAKNGKTFYAVWSTIEDDED